MSVDTAFYLLTIITETLLYVKVRNWVYTGEKGRYLHRGYNLKLIV